MFVNFSTLTARMCVHNQDSQQDCVCAFQLSQHVCVFVHTQLSNKVCVFASSTFRTSVCENVHSQLSQQRFVCAFSNVNTECVCMCMLNVHTSRVCIPTFHDRCVCIFNSYIKKYMCIFKFHNSGVCVHSQLLQFVFEHLQLLLTNLNFHNKRV